MNLLVSVRSEAEAEAALAGGAALIDVKEPDRGSLGRAEEGVIAAVVRTVAGRRPVSAALGELADAPEPPILPLAFAKWGLAGWLRRSDWPHHLASAAQSLPPHCRPVAVAYADWHRAAAPCPADVCAFATHRKWGAFLLDTWQKDGTTLLDWLTLDELSELRGRCRNAGVPIALAGSLGAEQLRRLRPLQPDWFAVRGAVCRGGERARAIDQDRVRRLVELVAEPIGVAIRSG